MSKNVNDVLSKLPRNWQVFIREYIIDMKPIRAAKEAGFKGKDSVLKVTACRLLKKPRIKEAIDALLTPQLEEAELDAKQVLKQLHNFLYYDIIDLVDDDGYLKCKIKDIPSHVRQCITGWEVEEEFGKDEDGDRIVVGQRIKVKLVNKEVAMKLAMQYLRLLDPDKVTNVSMNFWQQFNQQVADPSTIRDTVGERVTKIIEGGKSGQNRP